MNIYTFKIKSYSFLEKLIGKRLLKKYEILIYTQFTSNLGIHFFHIPKSGGTSISQLLYGRRIGHNSYEDVFRIKGERYFDKLIIFSVVRDPLQRLISSYRFALTGGELGDAKMKDKYNRDERFSNFDRFVNEWLVHQNLNEIDILFRPQYKFICDNNDKIVTENVFKIENIKKIENFLEEVLNENIDIPHLNKTGGGNENLNIANSTKKTVIKLYQHDYKLFNYL